MELERLDAQQFQKFCDFVYAKSGIRFSERKITLLSNRIRRRMRERDLGSFDEYFQFLTSSAGAAELPRFLDAVTTNETYFFRTEKQFDWFREDFLTDIMTRKREQSPRTMRVLSAGCASGAEVYSLAICLAENAFRLRGWEIEVVGCDISAEMLAVARAGVYKEQAIEAVSDRRRRRYLKKAPGEGRWEVRDEVKALTSFRLHNLMEPLGRREFDCVFIRNVLIYFDDQSKQQVLDHLSASLVEGGFLVLGPSEGVHDCDLALQRVSPLIFHKTSSSK